MAEREEDENQTAIAAIRVLLLTGMRRMEVLTLRRDAIDFRARCVRFADTKSGPQIRAVGRAAMQLLTLLTRDNAQTFVFPGTAGNDHFVGLPRIWDRISSGAGIAGVSLHGLRHWYTSVAAEMNYSELTIAGLLGHKVKAVTARYATMPDAALLAAADAVSTRIAASLSGRRAITDN